MENIIPVVFRVDRDGYVFALFPTIQATSEGHCQSYQHVGQHGAADYHLCIACSRPATLSEYVPLKRELERIGYHLQVYRRRPRSVS
jgi:hypothetical protein